MVLRRWIIALLLLLPMPLAAQTDEALEAWVEETGDEQAAGEMSDQWRQLQAQPVNLNDSTAVATCSHPSNARRCTTTYCCTGSC